MWEGQLVSSTARAASAGFRKLWPMPPNSCLTTMMAKALPISGIHSGTLAGRFRASSRPVTAADRSATRMGLWPSFCHKNSESTAAATLIRMISTALMP